MEHRSYLPAAGLLIALAHTDPLRKIAAGHSFGQWIAAAVILFFTVVTYIRLPVFSGEYNYWKNAYETSKHSAVVCRDYGVILTKMGDYPNAEKAYLEGIRRNPKETLLHYNLGVMYFKMGQLDLAKEQLAKELEINTTNFMIYHVLGVIYEKQGRNEEAAMMWEEAVSINPNFVESYKELLSHYSSVRDSLNFVRCKNILEKNGLRIVNKKDGER